MKASKEKLLTCFDAANDVDKASDDGDGEPTLKSMMLLIKAGKQILENENFRKVN